MGSSGASDASVSKVRDEKDHLHWEPLQSMLKNRSSTGVEKLEYDMKNATLPPNDSSRSEPTRRSLLVGAAAIATGLGVSPAMAADNANADFLFVQTAKSMAFAADINRLTLHDVSPVTLFFSDRPERIAGNMATTDFVPFWSEGDDSFQADNPNADLSILENGTLRQTVVELKDPVIEGDDLHYTVKIISGEMPVLGDQVSLFIDVIGMPLSPVSFAGAGRRAYRRAIIR